MSQENKPRRLIDLFDWLRGKPPAPYAPPPPAPLPVEPPKLHVTSHVARDLLQNAAYFSALPKAVAEYVTNAIDSAEPGTPVRCEIVIAVEEIAISDNGSGMTYTELSNFFQMHGENAQRKRGRTVRGKFGTGKSAAFGIANVLQIETRKDGLRNVVELHRTDVEAAPDGQPIKVREIAVNQADTGPAGTTIRMRELLVEKIDAGEVQLYLEKLLGQHLRSHKIIVNGKACKYRMPEVELTFDFKPPAPVAGVIGTAKCSLRVSPKVLAREDNTIAVLCHGYLHATTLAGRNREPLVEYVFGEVEVPALDDDPGPVPAFDNTRSLSLNPQNPRVQALEAWLGECLDEVLKKLVERERRRQQAREQHLLRRMAGEIKSFLDDDFLAIQQSMPWASLPGARKRADKEEKTRPRNAAPPRRKQPPSVIERGLGWVRRLFGLEAAPPAPQPRRGEAVAFEIRYARQGANTPRARYDIKEGVITINRDHPQLRSAEREAGIESRTYRMLSFDVAFTEYALVVADTLSRRAVTYKQTIDPNELVQQIIDRLGRKAAEYLETSLAVEENDEE
jgi:hypothetical protein